MTTETTTLTVTTTNAVEVADRLNARFAEAGALTVNGKTVRSWSAKPATSWQTGSVSVDVAKRNGQPGGTVWVKPGQTVTFA